MKNCINNITKNHNIKNYPFKKVSNIINNTTKTNMNTNTNIK